MLVCVLYLILASFAQMRNGENEANDGSSEQSIFPIDVGNMFSLASGDSFESRSTSPSSKRTGSTLEWMRSKRPMYCRNAYMHYLVKQLVKHNPYISLQSILDVLEEKHVEYKTISVAKARSDERSLYITSMKDIVPKLQSLSMPSSLFIIRKCDFRDKQERRSGNHHIQHWRKGAAFGCVCLPIFLSADSSNQKSSALSGLLLFEGRSVRCTVSCF